MLKLRTFANLSAMIPWPLLVAGFKNDTLTFVMLIFQLICFFSWIYLDNKNKYNDNI